MGLGRRSGLHGHIHGLGDGALGCQRFDVEGIGAAGQHHGIGQGHGHHHVFHGHGLAGIAEGHGDIAGLTGHQVALAVAVAADDDIGLRRGGLRVGFFVVRLGGDDGGVIDLAGYNSIVVALGNDKLQGVIAAAHIVYACQLDYHTFIGAAYCPFFNFSTGAGASQEAAVARGGNREIILAVAGGPIKAQKVIVSNIQGQINIVALYDLRAGIDLIRRGTGIFGVLFVIGHVLVVHLPVVAAAANSIQPETVSGLFAAQGALGLEYRGNSRVAGNINFAEICNRLCISIAYFICSTDKFIARICSERYFYFFYIIR